MAEQPHGQIMLPHGRIALVHVHHQSLHRVAHEDEEGGADPESEQEGINGLEIEELVRPPEVLIRLYHPGVAGHREEGHDRTDPRELQEPHDEDPEEDEDQLELFIPG